MEWRGELYILIPRLLLWVPHSRRLILDSRFWILSLRLIWQMQWTSTTCLKAQCQIIKLSCARTTFLQMRPNVVKLCRVCATLFYTNSSPMLPTIFATLNENNRISTERSFLIVLRNHIKTYGFWASSSKNLWFYKVFEHVSAQLEMSTIRNEHN